jgi:2-oxoglutarate ferredoxin oxidoreductase subunit beta
MHDGSRLYLKKLGHDYDPTDKGTALRVLRETAEKNEFATGILYIEPQKYDFTTLLNLVDEPLATLPLDRVRPPKDVLDSIMESLK